MDHPADHLVYLPIHHQDLRTRGAIHRQLHLTLQVPHIHLQLVGRHLQPVGRHLQLVGRQPEVWPVLAPIEPELLPLHIQTVICLQAKLTSLFTFIIERQTTITRLDTIPTYTCRNITTDTGITSTTKPMGTTSTQKTMNM